MSPPGPERRGPVPLTLVTGFLGAGKTTVVNHRLHTAATARIDVVEIELDEVFEVQPPPPWDEEPRVTRVVFISRGLDAAEPQAAPSSSSVSSRPDLPLETRRVCG